MQRLIRLLKYVDEALIVIGLLIVAGVIVLIRISHTAETVGELVYKGASKNFTAANSLAVKSKDKLTPIAAYSEYRRCGSGVFSARLAGEPLACSASNYTDNLLRDPGQPGQTFYRQFGAACNRHDLCYIHGDVTYGLARKDCDKAFLADILKTCSLIYSDRPARPLFGIKIPFNLRKYCHFRASVGYSAVSLFGWQYYKENYSPVCDYESGPHAVRDHIVSGKFLDGDKRDYLVSLRLLSDHDTVKVTISRVNDQGQSEEIALDSGTISASQVKVVDRERACQQVVRHSQKDKLCPEDFRLGATLVTARDWLRFNPVIVDHDGDGKDEIVLVSVSPDFGLGLTHFRFDGDGDGAKLSVSAYLGADRRIDSARISECEWGLEFHNCLGTVKLNEAFRLNAPASYKRAVKKLEIAKEELKEAETRNEEKKIKRAKRAIARAEATIRKTSSYKEASASAGIRTWRKEMQGFDKTKLREEDHFILSHDGTNQKTVHQIVPLSVKSGDLRVHDLAMMSAHAYVDESGDEDAGHVFRRFRFDRQKGFWLMSRDVFARDGHRVAKCSFENDEERLRFDQYRRYQYRVFPMRLHGYGDDRLATFQREKCPTSAINPNAGALGDVDVMVYSLEKDYQESNDFRDPAKWRESRLLKLAYTSWFPLIWTEAAHPLITSEKARDKKIHFMGTYIGGAAKIKYPVVAILRDSQDLHVRMLKADERRLPDTYGKLSERYYLKWDRKKWGKPESYFELPSVLSTFDVNGGDGLSLVFFTNEQTAVWQKSWDDDDLKPTKKAIPSEGTFRALIFPIPEAFSREFSKARIIECPAGAVLQHPVKTFAPQFRGNRKKRKFLSSANDSASVGWKSHFLRHEPVLAGNFLAGGKGALVSAWRDENGDIGVTALYADGEKWRFGDQDCRSVAEVPVDRLY